MKTCVDVIENFQENITFLKKYSVLSHTTCAYVINRSLKSIANKIVKTCDEITDTKANSTTNYNKLPNKNCLNKF